MAFQSLGTQFICELNYMYSNGLGSIWLQLNGIYIYGSPINVEKSRFIYEFYVHKLVRVCLVPCERSGSHYLAGPIGS